MVDLDLSKQELSQLSDEKLKSLASKILQSRTEARRDNQILYYRPASELARQIHLSKANMIGIGGGNRSSKTESCIVEWVALATGVFPEDFKEEFAHKFRGPIHVRMVCESIKTVLYPIVLPKLQWWRWTGSPPAGQGLGHWGWIPKMCLKDGEWKRSWSERFMTLTVLCRNPDNLSEILGESVIQFMSFDQDPSDFASGTFHQIHIDEPPKWAIWKECQARVMDVGGRIMLSMTWPDEPGIAVDWIYDEVYEPGQKGPNKDPDIEWLDLHTVDNKFIDQESVARKARQWSEEVKRVRLLGQPLRFSNRIHPLFTDQDTWWCFKCQKPIVPIEGQCGSCGAFGSEVVMYNHVTDFDTNPAWPFIFLLDPHPRKPHMMLWVAIDPNDDLWVHSEAEVDGDAADVAQVVFDHEKQHSMEPRLRVMDPNMGRQPLGGRREQTWQDEFADAGLSVELGNTTDIGRKRLNQMLKPDRATMQPRILFHSRCANTCMQMKRYVWDDFRRADAKEQKQLAKQKYDDYPTLLKYLMNWSPTFSYLYSDPPVMRRGNLKSGYG